MRVCEIDAFLEEPMCLLPLSAGPCKSRVRGVGNCEEQEAGEGACASTTVSRGVWQHAIAAQEERKLKEEEDKKEQDLV